jgi:capsular polysaccharide transport system permease protein
MSTSNRLPLLVVLDTWKALFLREVVARISTERAAWLWILFEPLSHVGFILILYSTVRVRTIGGIDTIIWLMAGMLPFFTFRRTAVQCMHAINANRALFAYRQVKPIDTVFVRAGTEFFLMILVTLILFAIVALFGHDVVPDNPLGVLAGIFGLWLLGLGFGLTMSVVVEIVPEMERIVGFIMYPMYLLSGVMLPMASIPPEFRGWLLLNPIAHGLESVRLSFAPFYHAVPELNPFYLYEAALVLIFLGLALQLRFSDRMVME